MRNIWLGLLHPSSMQRNRNILNYQLVYLPVCQNSAMQIRTTLFEYKLGTRLRSGSLLFTNSMPLSLLSSLAPWGGGEVKKCIDFLGSSWIFQTHPQRDAAALYSGSVWEKLGEGMIEGCRPGVNPPSTIPNPIDFLIPIPVNLAIWFRIRFQ